MIYIEKPDKPTGYSIIRTHDTPTCPFAYYPSGCVFAHCTINEHQCYVAADDGLTCCPLARHKIIVVESQLE